MQFSLRFSSSPREIERSNTNACEGVDDEVVEAEAKAAGKTFSRVNIEVEALHVTSMCLLFHSVISVMKSKSAFFLGQKSVLKLEIISKS